MTAGKAAIIIYILSDKSNRDPRFLEYVTAKISRGEKCQQRAKHSVDGHTE